MWQAVAILKDSMQGALFRLVRATAAAGVSAAAVDVRRLGHCFALWSAVLAGVAGLARAVWMSAFLIVFSHFQFSFNINLDRANRDLMGKITLPR
jgi:hypothetical protein